ncbi:MAG: iron-sulfur cluster assembly scaffold protein [Sphingomicrobium sp.]
MSVGDPIYTREILRLAAAIPNQVDFAELAEESELRSPACGSRLRLAIDRDEEGCIVSVRQAVQACAFGQAAAALVASAAVGRTAQSLTEVDELVANWLSGKEASAPWPGLGLLEPARTRAGRHGAILLPFRALAREARRLQS